MARVAAGFNRLGPRIEWPCRGAAKDLLSLRAVARPGSLAGSGTVVVGVSQLERVLAGCRLIVLDTMVFSYCTSPSSPTCAWRRWMGRWRWKQRWCEPRTGLRTPAAIPVAAARVFGADAIIINDRRWAGRVARPALVMLEEYAEL